MTKIERIAAAKAQGLDSFTACGIIEAFADAPDGVTEIDAWQFLHDTGDAYRLQGFYGRGAQELISLGRIAN